MGGRERIMMSDDDKEGCAANALELGNKEGDNE
jgi:hypothetical protein